MIEEQNKLEQNIDFWNKKIQFNLDNLTGKLKFLFLCVFIGFGFIISGDFLYHVSFKISGISSIIIGAIIILMGFGSPLIIYLSSKNNG